jgi:uncharacterized membrane protein
MLHNWYGGWGPGAYAYGFPWGGLIMIIILVALVVFAIFAFVRVGKTTKSGGDPKERGLEILIERFSRGEIDTETFRTMKAELENKSGT